MAQPTNTLTTPEQRALWQKAISSPDQLTADERQEVLNEPPLATKIANILKVSGLTPEEFMAMYCGRIRVSLSSLFSWFYAVRASEKYTMEELWHKAQMQPAKCWYVQSMGGAYHTRLVLPKSGETRGTYTAEL